MSVKSKVIDVINDKSFITLKEFMQISLHDDEFGYYKKNKPIGNNGDFVTSPEISQLYGEMIGIWLSQVLITNKISFCNLVELGPGQGTLMKDILRVVTKLINKNSEIKLHFIENNFHFIKDIKKAFPQSKIHSNISTIPKEFSVYIANEFFDALPISQVKISNDKIKNLVIKRDINGNFYKDFEEVNDQKNSLLKKLNLNSGEIYEFSEDSDHIISFIGKNIKSYGGFILFADYGYTEMTYKSTLSSIKDNKITNFLDNMGEQDLTAHVNFNNILNIMNCHGVKNLNILKQSKFLKEMGIELRASKLIENNPEKEKEILNGLNRLINHEEMGSLFKIIYSEYK
ncbi:SAM-dependent methyltransferase [Pelagibacteraceae bacterium]|nr:SAM-dependent methyltransferase [Pelagibacteraceae bacterium]